jgi:hypothetical protein
MITGRNLKYSSASWALWSREKTMRTAYGGSGHPRYPVPDGPGSKISQSFLKFLAEIKDP